MKQKYKVCYGISSKTLDGYHIFMADYDNIPLAIVINELENIQRKFDLSDIFIISSEHGFNAFSFDKLTFNLLHSILVNTDYCDKEFIKYNFKREYYTLRVADDKHIEMILCNNSDKYEKSNAHRLFINWFYDLTYNKENEYDSFTGIDIIQYPSDKNGYHKLEVRT